MKNAIHFLALASLVASLAGCCGGGSGATQRMGQFRFVPQFDACTDRYVVTAAVGNDTPIQFSVLPGGATQVMQGVVGRQVRIQWQTYLGPDRTGTADVTRIISAGTEDVLLPPGVCLP